jgi:hypothetical protein
MVNGIEVKQYDKTWIVKYDDLGNGELDHKVVLCYDNRGNAVRISNMHLTEHYIYDHGDKVITLERRLNDPVLRSQVALVWGGTAEEQVFQFHYTYNKAGVVTRMDYANSTFQEWEFDNRKQISHILITDTSDVIEDLYYTLNDSGDILSINDNEYIYDGFDRITGGKTLVPGNTDRKKIVAAHFGAYENGSGETGIAYDVNANIFPEDTPDGRINGEDYSHAVLTAEDDTYDRVVTRDCLTFSWKSL